ncbi:Z-ring formation inhibitor MciZ [Paenibacillus sp. GYB003]|uniref:Z-ring formation inhibitor MciZ n=1 Tax=Paenibacillus sp. GYB003 TaxID=2994392 RepID=UPI003FA78E52
MKSYVTEKQLRMVGKGWEIRERLRQWGAAEGSGQAELAALLAKLTQSPERGKTQNERLRKPPYNRPDRRVIPFPSS